MATTSNDSTASEHVKRIAEVVVQIRGDNLSRRRATLEKVIYLATVDFRGREALSEGAGSNSAGGDSDVRVSAAGIEVSVEADEACDLAGFKVHYGRYIKDDGGVGYSGGGGIGSGDRTDAKGEKGRENEADEMHVGFLV